MNYEYGIGRHISRYEAKEIGLPFDELKLYNSEIRIGDQKAVVAILKHLQIENKMTSWNSLLQEVVKDELFTDDDKRENLEFIRYNIILAVRNLEVADLVKRCSENLFEITEKGKQINFATFDVWQDVYRISTVKLYQLRSTDDGINMANFDVVFKFKIKKRDN